MEAGGHVHSAVQLTEDDAGAGRGLVSAQAVARGEQLIVVPRKAQLFFTPDGADQQANLLQVIKTVNPHIRGMQLAVKLVQEKLKASDSAFQTYLSTLPESYDQLPLYYVDDIPELQFPSVEQQAVEHALEIVAFRAPMGMYCRVEQQHRHHQVPVHHRVKAIEVAASKKAVEEAAT